MKRRQGQAGIIAAVFIILIVTLAIISMYEIAGSELNLFNAQNQAFNNQVAKAEQKLVPLASSLTSVEYNVSSLEVNTGYPVPLYTNYSGIPPYLYQLNGSSSLSLNVLGYLFNFTAGSSYQSYGLSLGGIYSNDPNESFINVYGYNFILQEWGAIYSASLHPGENFNFLINVPSYCISAAGTPIIINGTYLSPSGPLPLNLKYIDFNHVNIIASEGAVPSILGTVYPSAVNYKEFEAVPITITNSQGLSTPSPFQQMVQVNIAGENGILSSGGYNTINVNGSNVRFFNSSSLSFHSELYAWLEGISGGVATYWVRIPGGIAADSHITLWMTVENSSVGFDGTFLGEASQLSPVYGQYDNGQYVFDWYNNGESTANLNLVNGGTLSLTTQANPYGHTSSVITLAGPGSTSTSAETVAWYTEPVAGNDLIFEGWVNIGPNLNALFSIRGSSDASLTNYLLGDGWTGSEATISYESGNTNTNLAASGTRTAGWFWNYMNVSGDELFDAIYSAPPDLGGTLLASTSIANSDLNSSNMFIGIATYAGETTAAYFFSMRIRALPPDNVMPAVSFGAPETMQMNLAELDNLDGNSFMMVGGSSTNITYSLPSNTLAAQAQIVLGSVSNDFINISITSALTHSAHLLMSTEIAAGQEVQLNIPLGDSYFEGNSTMLSIQPSTITEVDQAVILANQSSVTIQNQGPQPVTIVDIWMISSSSATVKSVSISIPPGGTYNISPYYTDGVYEVKLITSLGNTFVFPG